MYLNDREIEEVDLLMELIHAVSLQKGMRGQLIVEGG